MELVALVGLCLVTRCGITAAGVNGQGVVKVFAAEGSDVILPCSLSTKKNIQLEVFDWTKDGPRDREVFLYDAGSHYNNGRSGQSETFKGRVSHFPDQLKYGNASIIIRNTKMTDRGNYTCHFPRLQPDQKFHIELIFDPDPERSVLKDRTGENITGAAPKPWVTILGPTVDGELLQCEVQGAFPKPHVQWQDRAGNNLTAEEPQVLERGRSYDVTLNVTVTKPDYYRCVATQETIYHQIHSEIFVSLNESSTGWVEIVVTFLITLIGVLVAVLIYRHCNKQCSRPVPTSDTLCGSTSGAPSSSTSGAPSVTVALLKKEEPAPIQSELQDDL